MEDVERIPVVSILAYFLVPSTVCIIYETICMYHPPHIFTTRITISKLFQLTFRKIRSGSGCSFCAENTCRCTTFRIVRSCGALEILRMCQLGVDFELLTLDTAGDFGIGTFLEEEEISILKTQELKHGRLAMIAFGGAITQAVACNAHHFPFIPCSTC